MPLQHLLWPDHQQECFPAADLQRRIHRIDRLVDHLADRKKVHRIQKNRPAGHLADQKKVRQTRRIHQAVQKRIHPTRLLAAVVHQFAAEVHQQFALTDRLNRLTHL